MKIAVHQPNFLPYLGYFDKARQVDIFVIFDDVQFTPRGYTNRNKIKKPNGTIWLTVPITGDRMAPINEIRIADHVEWQEKHLKTLKHMYGKSDYYEIIIPRFQEIYDKGYTYLAEFNIDLLELCFELLGITTKMVFSSNLDIIAEDGNQRILKICKKLEADKYLSGESGRDYLELSSFQESGISVEFLDFSHPVYEQQFGDFIPNLSIIDYLMNEGPKKFW
ncbi:MAG: hypothetical protein BAJATHORv1_30179 [Candidatus Thorarchaeota archaeon]|nr:MAG: hypothetical protein BAJATHORv1_30179 [Candidatus Thorarchaeota archaeon]